LLIFSFLWPFLLGGTNILKLIVLILNLIKTHMLRLLFLYVFLLISLSIKNILVAFLSNYQKMLIGVSFVLEVLKK